MRFLSQRCYPKALILTVARIAPVVLLTFATLPAQAARHHHSRHGSTSTATYYSRGDSNPHLANGDYYGRSGPWFCAVDSSRRDLLNHRIRVINKRNGLSHVFLVSDLGRFSRGNVDISRGGSSRLSGRGAPDNFPVEWHDLGPVPGHAGRTPHKSQRHHKTKR